jgi:hypothetical protein
MEQIESKTIGEQQEPINENKNLVGSDIQKKNSMEVSGNGDGEAAEKEETMEDILNEASDMSLEELAELDEIAKSEVQNSKYVIFSYGPVIVSPDIKKLKRDVERVGSDDEIIQQDEYAVIQRHPLLGDIQKILQLSKRNSMRWQNLMKKAHKKWWKVSKKGTGFNTQYKFTPYEEK